MQPPGEYIHPAALRLAALTLQALGSAIKAGVSCIVLIILFVGTGLLTLTVASFDLLVSNTRPAWIIKGIILAMVYLAAR